MFKRRAYHILLSRLRESRHFIQVLAGPRQVGKTTLVKQVIESLEGSVHYASADDPTIQDRIWIEQQWNIGRLHAKQGNAYLILDEIQKIPEWSETIKRLWDEDTWKNSSLKVVLLGSAPLLLQKGLSDSLAGRFEIIPVTHWSLDEMQTAFSWTLEQYIYFGGYPGSAELIHDNNRWKRYIIDALIETTISRDILLMAPVQKPALLRRLFNLSCEYSGQILSFQKMTGQLQDAGNTTTLAHYLELLTAAGMVTGLAKFAGQRVRQRGSSPKLQVLNTALMSAQSQYELVSAQYDSTFWGRLVESSIGAYLINSCMGTSMQVFYWREGHKEVDFILQSGNQLLAIEVKSRARRENLPGLQTFSDHFNPQQVLLVGDQGMPLEDFLKTPIETWFK